MKTVYVYFHHCHYNNHRFAYYICSIGAKRKRRGLAGIAAGGATQQVLGARQAPDVLEKATWILATAFIVLCILSNFVIDTVPVPANSVIQERAQQEQTAPGALDLQDAVPTDAVPTDAGSTVPATGGDASSWGGSEEGGDGNP